MALFGGGNRRPRKPSREEQLAGLVAALREAVHQAIADSADVQGVVFQLRMLDVVAEITATVELEHRPESGHSQAIERQRDREWLSEMGMVVDGNQD